MKINEWVFQGIVFAILFTSVSIIVSLFSGLVWRSSIVVFVLSVLISVFIFRKFRIRREPHWTVYLLAVLGFILVAHPLLFIHPYFDSSADSAPTIATAVIKDRLPQDYSPYSNLKYNYQPGLPLFARIFADFFPGVPIHIILWMIACIFSAFQVILIYLVGSKLFGSEKAGIWAALLFLGTKLVFQNVFVGEYTWSVATVFFLGTFLMFMERNPLGYILYPAVFITHPGVALYSIIFIGIFGIFSGRWKDWIKLMASAAVAAPAFFTYSSAAGNIGSSLSIEAGIRAYSALPLFAGAIPVLLLVISVGWMISKKISWKREEKIAFGVLIAGIFLQGIFGVGVSPVMGVKIVEMIGIVVSLLAGSFLSRLEGRGLEVGLAAVILIGILAFFFTSSTLTEMRNGSKITPAEAAFALKFKEFDPGLKRVLIISPAGGKIAQYADKIPYNVRTNWFISSAGHISGRDEAYQEEVRREENWNNILNNRCVECMGGIDVDYIVVNRDVFPELNKTKVFEYKDFIVYDGK